MNKYTVNQKINIIINFYKSNQSITQYAKQVAIDVQRIKNWIKVYDQKGRSGFNNSKFNQIDKIKDLEKENKKLRRETEDLKLRDEMFAELRRMIDRKK
ncbi:transposase [Spiroplasma endosymbiont of Atherix ibis]|uniref:transposase n=1 Tax=Spiroplasma endosymbiont of Atherix ibis TaxID=3066291 RepID=UPI0030CEC4E0